MYVHILQILKGTSYSQEDTRFVVCPSDLTIQHIEGINGAPEDKIINYKVVSSNITGVPQCWLAQNLGADRQATSSNDASTEAAGWYWQFNRMQGYGHDGVNRYPNTAWITSISENNDWQMDKDPCRLLLGSEWRLPTKLEWAAADKNEGWNTYSDVFNSLLKLHAAGYMDYRTGGSVVRGIYGGYWSSNSYNSSVAYFFHVYSSQFVNTTYKTYGLSVRCVK